MKHTLSRRMLSLLLCFSLTLGCAAYRPQKASAVVTETAIAFGLASLIPYAITTGMKLSATNGGADAIASGIQELWDSFYARWQETDATIARSAEDELAYIGGQLLPTYKNGTLTLSDYVVGVYDKFVQWLMGEKGVTAGGDAVEVAKSVGGFTVTRCTFSASTGLPYLVQNFFSSKVDYWDSTAVIESLGVNDKVAVLGMTSEYFCGFYFDEVGIFAIGLFDNPYGAVNSSFFGVYDISALTLVSARCFTLGGSTNSSSATDFPVFYDMAIAQKYSDYLLSSLYAFCWSDSWYYVSGSRVRLSAYSKSRVDSVFSSSNSFYLYPGSQFLEGDVDPLSFVYYIPTSFSFVNSTLAAENDDYAAPALAEGKAMQISLNFRAGAPADDEADELPAAIYSAAAAPDDTATGWALTYDVVDADEGTTTEPDEEAGDAEEKNEYLPFIPRILDSIKALPSRIAEKISDLFSLDEDLVTEITDKFKSKFAFLSVLNQFVNDLFRMTPETDPPVIYIHLENAESKYGYQYGGQEIALDFAWYQKYKASVDGIIGGFLWLGYLWALFKKAPAIINGAELSNEGVPPMQNLEYINPLRLNGKIGKKRRK